MFCGFCRLKGDSIAPCNRPLFRKKGNFCHAKAMVITMKKITALLMLSLLLLTACGSAAFSESDITAFVGETRINIGDDMASVISKLGDGYEYSEAISCAYDGMDKTFDYGGVIIYTYPVGDKDYVLEVAFDSAEAGASNKDIKVGAGVADVTNAYGDGYEVSGVNYSYISGEDQLYFCIVNGVVESWGICKTVEENI